MALLGTRRHTPPYGVTTPGAAAVAHLLPPEIKLHMIRFKDDPLAELKQRVANLETELRLLKSHLETKPVSQVSRPWVTAGVSKATWYRRKQSKVS